MPSKSQRAEHLVLVRDLVVLGVSQQITRRAELHEAAVAKQVMVRVGNKQPLGYTSVYRYFDALRFLELDGSAKYGFEDHIVWTRRAIDLAYAGRSQYQTPTLSESEQAIFRTCIFLSSASQQFLSCFCPSKELPKDPDSFADLASSLFVVNESVKRPEGAGPPDWPAEDNVEITLDPGSAQVERRPRKEFLYTYRYWCLDTGIIDELNVREATRCGITKNQSYVLYAIDRRASFTSNDLLGAIYGLFSDGLQRPVVVPVPWLMYQICPQKQISIEKFKALLLEAWQTNRHLLHLERGPGGLISGRLHSPQLQYRDRYGNHRYYPVVDGTVRSNVAVFPSS